jgi:hypothetical protein
MLVYAFDQGGATAAGIVALVQLVPAALFAPYGGVLADRHPPAGILFGGYVCQGAAMGATAVSLLAGGPPALSYGLAALASTAVTITRPAQAVLVPELAHEPDELTAFNVVSSWIESACILVAPALAGVVLGLSTPGTVFAICAGLGLAAGIAVVGLIGRTPHEAAPAEPAGRGTLAELAAGLRAVGRTRASRLLVLFLGAQYVVIGALDVLAVVLAIDVLGLGEAGAGYLNAAFGAGAVIGAAVTVTLIGRRRLAPPLIGGATLAGAALIVLGALPTVLGAFLLLGVAGAGRIVLDVSGRTLLQRTAQPDVLSRTFALLEALAMAALALGSILVPALVAIGGASAALVAAGALMPALALLRLRTLLAIDSEATVPIVELSLLRSINIFASLPAPALERLARSLVPKRVPAGEVVLREGEPGHRFYAIAHGEVEITAQGRHLATRRRCEGFGEIALLRDEPRTATAVARTSVLLYGLDKEPFVAAVSGHDPAARAVEAVVHERLAAATAAHGEAEA